MKHVFTLNFYWSKLCSNSSNNSDMKQAWVITWSGIGYKGEKNNKKITVNWLKKEKVAGAKVFMHSVVFVHHVFRT